MGRARRQCSVSAPLIGCLRSRRGIRRSSKRGVRVRPLVSGCLCKPRSQRLSGSAKNAQDDEEPHQGRQAARKAWNPKSVSKRLHPVCTRADFIGASHDLLMGRRRLRKVVLDSHVKIMFVAHMAEASFDGSSLVNHGGGRGCGVVGGSLGRGGAGRGKGGRSKVG